MLVKTKMMQMLRMSGGRRKLPCSQLSLRRLCSYSFSYAPVCVSSAHYRRGTVVDSMSGMDQSQSMSRFHGISSSNDSMSSKIDRDGRSRGRSQRCFAVRRRPMPEPISTDTPLVHNPGHALDHSQSDSSSAGSTVTDYLQLSQRSSTWHSLRADRLTASAFGAVIGFFSKQRRELFEEKVPHKHQYQDHTNDAAIFFQLLS